MSLYPNFAKYYDLIFPFSNETCNFLTEQFEKGKTLDLGCATGEYALQLSRKGYEVVGIDIDKNMIAVALEKMKKLSLLATFLVGNCLDVVYTKTFQNIYCIGNTLVHLSGPAQIETSLKKIYGALKDKGKFIVQIVNYDRILANHLEGLPTISKDGATFERKYRFEDEILHFETKLNVDGKTFEDDTILYPILSKDLFALLKKVGFQNIKSFDGFSKKAFSSTKSVQLTIIAEK